MNDIADTESVDTDDSQTGGQIYRRLINYGLPYWPYFALAAGGMALYAASVAGLVMLVEPLIDGTFVEREESTNRWIPWAIFAIFVTRGLAGFLSTYYMEFIGRKVVTTMRQDLFSKLIDLPMHFYDHSSSGVLLSKLTYNTEQVSESVTRAITIMIRDTLTLFALLAWMIYMSPTLSLFILVIGPPIAFLIRYAGKRFRAYSERIQSSMGGVTQRTEEAINGHKVVKVYAGQTLENAEFHEVNERNRRAFMKQVLVKAVSVPVIQLIAALGLVGIISFAIRPDTGLTPGRFSSFIGAMLLLMDPLKRITDINSVIQRGIAGARSIFVVLDEQSESNSGQHTTETVSGSIHYSDVSFRYKGAENSVLTNIELTVEPGQTVAFVGRSGSGKTTLVSLLPRFYDPTSGTISLDGVKVSEYQLNNLRNHIALVSQDITLFNDTIANNIAYGSLRNASLEDIEIAATKAHVMDFVSRMPKGLQTMVGDKGVLLSGGQRQRIAIARALLKNAPVLVLDEATASLDSQSEQIIQTALKELMLDRTTLVIAHRLTTIENADNIIVMDEGRIMETGTHDELISQKGLYASLHDIQFSASGAEHSAKST
ncbi:MAG: lipid A export permease/ATP-binding protein MsbA [Gammaproteobacteria bacterium]